MIEKALKTDNKILSEISIESKMHWNYPLEWLELWLKDLTISEEYIERNYVFKLIIKNEVAGFVAVEKSGAAFEVAHLWVRPRYIGKGYGKKLLEYAVNEVITSGSEILVLSDPNAEAFYKGQGFSTYGYKESNPKGRFLPLMRKIKN